MQTLWLSLKSFHWLCKSRVTDKMHKLFGHIYAHTRVHTCIYTHKDLFLLEWNVLVKSQWVKKQAVSVYKPQSLWCPCRFHASLLPSKWSYSDYFHIPDEDEREVKWFPNAPNSNSQVQICDFNLLSCWLHRNYHVTWLCSRSDVTKKNQYIDLRHGNMHI